MPRWKNEQLRKMSTDEIAELIRAWAALKWPDKALRWFQIMFADGDNCTRPFGPRCPGEVDEQETLLDLTECEADIVDVITSTGSRLQTEDVKDALKTSLRQQGKETHGESTIVQALATLTRRKKVLTNKTDEYGKGYGLAEWG